MLITLQMMAIMMMGTMMFTLYVDYGNDDNDIVVHPVDDNDER